MDGNDLTPAAGTGTWPRRSEPDLAGLIDHTLLKPDATRDQLKKLCDEAREYQLYSVCVNSANVPFCRQLLADSKVKVIAVVGCQHRVQGLRGRGCREQRCGRDRHGHQCR